MRVGIFAKTFARPAVEGVLDAVRAHGIDCVQFNLACAGLPSMPDRVEGSMTARIREAAGARGIAVAALSGTFNMIHPDAAVRRDGLRRLRVVAEAARAIGAPLVTLCTGSRDAQDMWRRHPGNDAPDAWADLEASMREALAIAEGEDIRLGVEPEVANVVDSAVKARRLLDAMGSPRLKIVMDGANLFHAGELPRMREVLDGAFDLLGRDIALAHAKDLSRDGEAGHEAAGTGVLDYDHYLRLLRRVGLEGPLILHGLREEQVAACVTFLRGKLAGTEIV